MPIYDKFEDNHLDDSPQEAIDCNNGLDHQEEEEDSKWDISLCFSDSKIILVDSMGKHNDISFKTLGRNQVLNSGIFNEIVDISCTSCQEHSLHDFFEE